MTTPQSMLFDVHYKINDLIKKFDRYNEDDEDHRDLFDRVKDLEKAIIEIAKSIDALSNQMNLIIKLLSKD